jgi:hypothetical protein
MIVVFGYYSVSIGLGYAGVTIAEKGEKHCEMDKFFG